MRPVVKPHWLAPADAVRLEEEGTTAFRICSADTFWIERFGRTALISVKHQDDTQRLLSELEDWQNQTPVALDRVYVRNLVRQPREKDLPHLLRGEAANTQEIVSENFLRYEVDFAASYSVGLFCDQRANRQYLQNRAPRRVLNTFAYTCAFSVAAAAAGAETLSVDLSKASLHRGRRNFSLNGLDPAGHRFIADDVLEVLPRLARRQEKFDAIILDPPTFGRAGPKRAFRAKDDFETLIDAALACAEPGAAILLSTNCTSLNTHALRRMASRSARGACRFHQEPPLIDIPAPHAASTLWMVLERR